MRAHMRISKLVLICLCLLSVAAYGFSPEGAEGKGKFAVCNACHNPALDPPLAPPMWGVQRRYKGIAQDRDQFINMVAGFAASPTLEKAVFRRAVTLLGLMPAVSLPEADLKEIAAYIWEEEFAPPCAHWENGAARAEQMGDSTHAEKDRVMLEMFCGR